MIVDDKVKKLEQLVEQHPDIFGNVDFDAPWPTPYGYNPPAEWMEPNPNLKPAQNAIITPEARVSVWLHNWKMPHANKPGWTAQPSQTGNKYFNRGIVQTKEGDVVKAGMLPLKGGHAPKPHGTVLSTKEVMGHYDDPDTIRAIGRATDLEYGCQFNGFLIPGTTFSEVGLMRIAGLSSDWRRVPGLRGLEFIAACFVPTPAIPDAIMASVGHVFDKNFEMFFSDSEQMVDVFEDDTGHVLSVTASYGSAVSSKVEDKYPPLNDTRNKKMEEEVEVQETKVSDEASEESGKDLKDLADQIDSMGKGLEKALESLESLELRVIALESDSENIDLLDLEVPDT